MHQICAYDGDGIRRTLRALLDPSQFSQYKAYMRYKIATRLSSFCTKEYDEEFFDFYSRKLRGQKEQKTNTKRSVAVVNHYAGEMNGKIFVARHFSESSKENVKKMIEEVLSIMKVSIENNDWLTSTTKTKALLKLSKFRVKIGYPDVWKDYTMFTPEIGDSLYVISKKAKEWKLQTEFFDKINNVLDREEWRMTPQTVNAYFMPTQNEIVFPAAILQPPFFTTNDVDFDVAEEKKTIDDAAIAKAANFGGIGAVIAHEITHGYDDKGRRFDGDGNLNDWWQKDDADLFEKKAENMASLASGYMYTDTNGKEYRMNPQLCMGENLADLGGLSLSIQALKASLRDASPNVVKAHLRVAFKSWANVWKLNIREDNRIQRLTTDPHAPADFRGNLLKMIPDWHSVFGCKEGDGMWLAEKDRVHMW